MLRNRSRFPARRTRGGAASGNSAEAQQFFDRLVTPPTGARATAYAMLIDTLVASGDWAELDVLMIYAAADAATSMINLKQSAYYGTAVSSSVFAADQGWTGGSPVNKYVDTNFNTQTAAAGGAKFQQNLATFGAWARVGVTENKVLIGGDGGGYTDIWPDSFGVGAIFSCNNNAQDNSVSVGGNPTGFHICKRINSTTVRYYKDGTQLSSVSRTSTTPKNANLTLASSSQVAAAVIGGNLNPATVDSAVRAYLTTIGAI